MKIFAIANHKGGVGKTTTCISLSACLAEMGYQTLLIDLDPQSNSSSGLGIVPEPGRSLYPVILGEKSIEDQILPTAYDNLHVIPCEVDLSGCEVEIARREQHPSTFLRGLFADFRKTELFDYVLLDCPPSLGILMTNAVAAAESVLVPLQCEYFAMEGLSMMMHLIEKIKAANEHIAPNISGVIMTMYDSRTRLSEQVVTEVRKCLPDLVFSTIIPRTVRLAEAPSHGQPITAYDSNGIGAQSYRQLAKEFIQRVESKKS